MSVFMATVADILAVKDTQVHTVEPQATVYQAIEKMVKNNEE